MINLLELSIVNVHYRTYYKNIWVYEKNNEVAGCIIAYDGSKEMEYEEQWNQLPLEEDIRLVGTPLPIKEAKMMSGILKQWSHRLIIEDKVLRHNCWNTDHHKF